MAVVIPSGEMDANFAAQVSAGAQAGAPTVLSTGLYQWGLNTPWLVSNRFSAGHSLLPFMEWTAVPCGLYCLDG